MSAFTVGSLDPWHSSRTLLRTLKYEFAGQIDFSSKGDLIMLITWLEDRKIRELDVEWRKPLRSDSAEWDAAFSNYLGKVGCPFKWSDINKSDGRDAIAWLISYAVSAEYEDVAENCVGIENADNFLDSVKNAGEETSGEQDMEVEVDSELSEEVDKLGGMLLLSRGQGENDYAYLQRLSRHIKLTLTPGSLHTLKTEGKEGIPLESFPLGFDTKDETLNQVATVMRMLYLSDFRELQNDLNALIMLGQEYTANPKTNSALGQVGR